MSNTYPRPTHTDPKNTKVPPKQSLRCLTERGTKGQLISSV
jgi:hypothetical protein